MIINGNYSGYLNDGVMEWTCPITDEPMQSEGEFNCDGDYYYHEVTDDDGRLIYIVKAN